MPGIQPGTREGQDDGETCSYVQYKHAKNIRLLLWLTRQGRMREDVFSQPRKSSCSHNSICAGFAVYEAFSNCHFVWSSDSLWEKHRVNIMIHIFIDNFQRLSQCLPNCKWERRYSNLVSSHSVVSWEDFSPNPNPNGKFSHEAL